MYLPGAHSDPQSLSYRIEQPIFPANLVGSLLGRRTIESVGSAKSREGMGCADGGYGFQVVDNGIGFALENIPKALKGAPTDLKAMVVDCPQ